MTDCKIFTDWQVQCWVEERLANCERIAKMKTGKDRDGWLEDASYFRRAIELIKAGRGAGGTPGERAQEMKP